MINFIQRLNVAYDTSKLAKLVHSRKSCGSSEVLKGTQGFLEPRLRKTRLDVATLFEWREEKLSQITGREQKCVQNQIIKKVQRALENVLVGTFFPPGSGLVTPGLDPSWIVIEIFGITYTA